MNALPVLTEEVRADDVRRRSDVREAIAGVAPGASFTAEIDDEMAACPNGAELQRSHFESRCRHAALVDLPKVNHPKYENEERAVVDLIDHAIVAGAYPPLSRTTDKASSRQF